MKWFVLLVFVEYFLCLAVETINSGKLDTLKRIKASHIQWIPALIACALLILMCGLRYEYWGDAIVYTPNFESFEFNSFKEIWASYDWTVSGDGFYLISKLFKFYISDNIHAYYIFVAAASIVPVFICYYRTSEALEYAIAIYIMFGAYFMNTTALKQILAVGWIFLIFPLIHKRKWYLYIPLVLLFAQFHKSALIFIPIYFLAGIKSEKILDYLPFIVIGIGLFLAVTYPVSGPVLARFLGESNADAESSSGGSSPVRIIISLIPVIAGWLFRKRIRPCAKYFDVVLVMSSFCVVWYSLAIFYWLYARLAMYFVPYSILLICYIVKYGVSEKRRLFWYFAVLAVFFAYFLYDQSRYTTWDTSWFYWNYKGPSDNPYYYIDKLK